MKIDSSNDESRYYQEINCLLRLVKNMYSKILLRFFTVYYSFVIDFTRQKPE